MRINSYLDGKHCILSNVVLSAAIEIGLSDVQYFFVHERKKNIFRKMQSVVVFL